MSVITDTSPPGAENSSTAPCESGCRTETTNNVNSNYTLDSDLVKNGIELVPIWKIHPAPENDDVYGVISPNDPEVIQLAKSIKEHGLQEPILISTDRYIISGHRRLVACRLAKLDHVQVRVHPISRSENKDEFVKLLVEMNSQRIKSTSVLIRETLVKIDPKSAYQQIINDRKEKSDISLSGIFPHSNGRRCEISKASMPLLNAIMKVLAEQKDYWPISARQIHYRLLGPDAPLKHARKPDSKYVNDVDSYKKLISVLSRGRTEGRISWVAIEDETRPVYEPKAFWNTAEFFRQNFRGFLKGYWRNRQQSQPSHIEIVGEKLTVKSILEKVAEEYTIPLTISRGMASLPCKKGIADRFFASKKSNLILLVVSDLDPAGDAIAEDLVKCFGRDFGIRSDSDYWIKAYKVALTIEQVEELELAPSMDAKESSPTYQAFVDRYGITDAYELEAMEPIDLELSLENAIEEVMDIDLYNQELKAEEKDSSEIIAVQNRVQEFFGSLKLDHGEVSDLNGGSK
jgi:hypothetical protein